MKVFAVMLVLLSALFSTELKVDVLGIKESKGSIMVALFKDTQKEIFPKVSSNVKTMTMEAKKDNKHNVIFKNIKSGYYAVIVLHDINNNQKLDTFFGIPTEPIGSSGEFTKSKPSYEKSKFFVEENSTKIMEIEVH